ncbi:MAG: ABC transporter substrate-binding protein [Desulfobulbaceae bacterium]|nr:MAG: ABC transporter substrate-binding protein [Desulfobulbaceae bacterium]
MFCSKTRKVMTLLVSTFFTVTVFLSEVTMASDAKSDLPTVKIVYWRSIDDLPLYVGVEKGYFKEAGINVELEYIKGESNVLAAVMRGDVDAGYISLASLIKLAEKKVPIKVVMWMGHAHKGTKCGIHVGAQSRYQTLEDIKGLRIATSGSINSKTMLTHALAKGGHTMKDIRPLWGSTPDNPMQYEAALRSGGVDAFIV